MLAAAEVYAAHVAENAASFDAVYEEFHRPLFNFLARLSRSRDVAEDLLEETWLRLVGHARRLAPDTRLKPWLFTVARNLYASYCRSRVLDQSLSADVIGLWPVSPPEPSPFEQAAAGELERRVERALGRMPVAYRELLLLVDALARERELARPRDHCLDPRLCHRSGGENQACASQREGGYSGRNHTLHTFEISMAAAFMA